ncbi:hypothetical protein LX73_0924 [Fodinibius salinus]|uniref:DUF4175 family protein n=1 Tax=Fodinibius salinus TaxID=860790 RepID=A0A5D3YR81_9BACT|nr:DUF4175 family protein [Fodinibius salinus]TYP95609.1 hypothetical protein LX73_0924 [Fodinibius salinus]
MNVDEQTYERMQHLISVIQKHLTSLVRRKRMLVGFLFFIISLGGLLLGSIAETVFFFPAWIKVSIWLLLVVSATASSLYLYSNLPDRSFETFYHQFGKYHNLPWLSNALDLYYDDTTDHSPLHDAAIRQNLDNLSTDEVHTKLKDFINDHRIYNWFQKATAALTVIVITLISFAIWQPATINRMLHAGTNYMPPNPYQFTIDPGSITLEQGSSITPNITFQGDIPENISLAFKTDIEKEFRRRKANSVNNKTARFSPVSISADGKYYITMDGFKSKTFDISVQLRPRFEELQAKVVPPPYTRLDTSSYRYPFSKIQAYKGSKIILSATTNKAIAELNLLQTGAEDTTKKLTTADSLTYQHTWTVTSTDTISFRMSDQAGLTNDNKFRFVITPKKDQDPFVNLIEPGQNIRMKTPENISLLYEAGDDFDLTSATLNYRLQRAFTDKAQIRSISLGKPAMNREEHYDWNIPALDPKPRDVITFWITVTDNDATNGYKKGRSQKLTITFPSTTEYMDELETKEDDITESMDKVSDSFDQMQNQYQQFKENLKRNPETNWKQKQQLEDVQKQKQKLNKEVEKLNKNFEKIRKEIQKNDALSPETMKSYQELQKLMKDIDDPELSKALEKLRKNMGQMTPEQMRKALEEYEFNEQLYKERINRTKELFKALKLNSDLDKMAKSLEKLAEQEKEISQSKQSPKNDLEQQKSVSEDLSQLQNKLDSLDNVAPKKARKEINKLQKNTEKQMNETRENIKENMQQLQNQQQAPKSSPETRQQQRNIQKQMQQMAQQIESAKQKMNQQQRQINKRALEYVLYSLLNLSTNQEELTKETENLPPRSQAFIEKARQEQNIRQQFAAISDSLFQLSADIPSFSNQINKKKVEINNKLNRAVTMLSERNKSNSTFAQRQSLGGINTLATMVASLLDQLQNQQGGSGGGMMSMQQFMEQIKKMSGQQQKLNKQIQQMINDIQGERLSRDQMERLNQMAKQQNKIRKQLKELQRNGELESGDRVLSELERMSKKMEDAINDLRGGQLNGQLMQRQKNILSRMLSAQKAVQERGKEKRREATTAEEMRKSTPSDLTIEELQQRIRKMLNDPDYTKFTDDYQQLVEQYFKLLKEQKKETLN